MFRFPDFPVDTSSTRARLVCILSDAELRQVAGTLTRSLRPGNTPASSILNVLKSLSLAHRRIDRMVRLGNSTSDWKSPYKLQEYAWIIEIGNGRSTIKPIERKGIFPVAKSIQNTHNNTQQTKQGETAGVQAIVGSMRLTTACPHNCLRFCGSQVRQPL